MNSNDQPAPTRAEKRALRRARQRAIMSPLGPSSPEDDLTSHLERELGEALGHSMAHPELVPLRLKFSARLFGGTLDSQLASGRSPEEYPLLSERALVIATPTWRANLAKSWSNLIPQAANPPARSRFDIQVPLNCREILSCAHEIENMVERLLAPLVAIRGVAFASTVLTDGAGPVYYDCSSQRLSDLLGEIVTYLNPAHHA
jgi:hypothetical protein